MEAAEILAKLQHLGVTAYAKGEKLVCEPGSLLPPDLKPEIRQRKAELLGLIAQRQRAVGDGQLPALDRPPETEAELWRLMDSLAAPIAFSKFSGEPTETEVPSVTVSPPVLVKDGRDLLLQRLMAGVRWMDAQHQAWIDGKPDAATDERFSTALEGWDFLERKLRHEYGYEGCIFGPGQHCPEDAPVRCDACVDDQD